MTIPDRPTPQPLPAPGPPPHPVGTTHPVPTRPTSPPPPPRPTTGHLPIDAFGNQLPMLGQVIRDAERLGAQMLSVLDRDYDVASAPSAEDDPTGLGFVEIRILSAIADVRSSLKMLEQISEIGLPPVGSAIQYPGPSDSSACLSGGSASHPVRRPGEGLRPGSAAGARTTSARIDRAAVAPVEGANHLAAAAASGGLLPGLVVPPGESEATRLGRDAGESSDPRPRIGGDAPEMTGVLTSRDEHHDVRPGVGPPHITSAAAACQCLMCRPPHTYNTGGTFSLPQAKQWTA